MKPVVSDNTLLQERKEGLSLIAPLKSKVTATEVTTADQYTEASLILTQIQQAKAKWLSRINPIIEPIRSGLDLLYDLRKDIVDPLEELEASLKKSMKAFKLEEARLLREADERKAADEARLRQQIAEKEAAEAKARTKAMTSKILDAKARLQQALAESQHKAAPEPVKAVGSTSRKKMKWRVIDLSAFLYYVLNSREEDLSSLIRVDETQLNAFFRLAKPQAGQQWLPGIEVYEDIDIAGRS